LSGKASIGQEACAAGSAAERLAVDEDAHAPQHLGLGGGVTVVEVVKDDLALDLGLMAADEGDNPEERPRQAQQDIPFEMICCG